MGHPPNTPCYQAGAPQATPGPQHHSDPAPFSAPHSWGPRRPRPGPSTTLTPPRSQLRTPGVPAGHAPGPSTILTPPLSQLCTPGVPTPTCSLAVLVRQPFPTHPLLGCFRLLRWHLASTGGTGFEWGEGYRKEVVSGRRPAGA